MKLNNSIFDETTVLFMWNNMRVMNDWINFNLKGFVGKHLKWRCSSMSSKYLLWEFSDINLNTGWSKLR